MEHDQQKAAVQWFRIQYPALKPYLFSIPNGSVLAGYDAAKRGQHMQYLLDEGFATGLPDLMLLYPRKCYHGLVLEMKDEGRTRSAVTIEQRNYLDAFRRVGYAAAWAAGFDAAREVISSYMNGVFNEELYL